MKNTHTEVFEKNRENFQRCQENAQAVLTDLIIDSIQSVTLAKEIALGALASATQYIKDGV